MSFRDLEQRSYLEISCQILFGDLFLGPDHVQRSCKYFFYRELVQRSCAEIPTAILPRDFFFWRLCTEILQRRPPLEFLYRDLVLMFCRDLAKRSLTEILCGDHWQRLATKISTKGTYTGSRAQDLLQIPLPRDLAQQLLQRCCQGDLGHDLLLFTKETCGN